MLLNPERMKKIKKEIKHNFFSHRRPASRFADKGLLEVCLSIFADFNKTYCILLLNEAGVPPVKAFLLLYREYYYIAPDKKFTMQDSQNIGSLMTFIFIEVLGYKVKKERAQVGLFGIATGRVFVKDEPAQLSIPVQETDDGSLTYGISE